MVLKIIKFSVAFPSIKLIILITEILINNAIYLKYLTKNHAQIKNLANSKNLRYRYYQERQKWSSKNK